MTDVDFEFSPHTSFVVCAANDFSSFDLQTLLDYYQPIMSPHALGLFLALKAQLVKQPLVTDAQSVSSLLLRVNVGFNQMKDALCQLEGLRLLQTFHQADNPDLLVFELQRTLTPTEFLRDDLLSVLCLQVVGDERFKQLGEQAKQYQFDLSNYENLSHSFFDVFSIDRESQTVNDPSIQHARQALDRLVNRRVENKQLPESNFDFHFLAQQLADQGVDEQELRQNQHLILTEHLVYGLDELSMAKLLAQAVDLVSGKLDINHFKHLVCESASQPVAKKSVAEDQAGVSPSESQADDKSDFSDQERALLSACEQARPIDFLRQLKQQTGSGYVSPAEKNTVERLVSNLNSAAVNVLIWYIIGERGNSSLGANFADAIANNWLQQGVNSAASALHAAKSYQRQRQSIQRPRRSNYHKKKAVHEKLPKWAQPGYKEDNEEASPEQAAAMRRLLAAGEQNNQDKRQ